MPDEPKSDGVNRTGLDYRAGYLEGLHALAAQLNLAALRAKPAEKKGLERAFGLAKALNDDMKAKMKA